MTYTPTHTLHQSDDSSISTHGRISQRDIIYLMYFRWAQLWVNWVTWLREVVWLVEGRMWTLIIWFSTSSHFLRTGTFRNCILLLHSYYTGIECRLALNNNIFLWIISIEYVGIINIIYLNPTCTFFSLLGHNTCTSRASAYLLI